MMDFNDAPQQQYDKPIAAAQGMPFAAKIPTENLGYTKAANQGPKSIADLMAKQFPPIKWIVKDVLPEGLSLIAGAPKSGKSWLCFDMALAVSLGGKAFGDVDVEQGDVLLLALEDGERRIKSRFTTLIPNADWSKSKIQYESMSSYPPFPTLDQGGLERLEEWADSVQSPRLIVIDVLEKVRPETKGNETEYKALYRGLKDIHTFAVTRGIAVLVIHHTRKGRASNGDPFQKVSGSMAFTAIPDTTLVLDHSTNGNCDALLYGRGRDLPEFELALDFSDGQWTVLGEKGEVERSDQRRKVLKIMRDRRSTHGYKPKEIAEALGIKQNTAAQLLGRMAKAGELKKLAQGVYDVSCDH